MKIKDLDTKKFHVIVDISVDTQFFVDEAGQWHRNYVKEFQVSMRVTVLRRVRGIKPANSGPGLVVGIIRMHPAVCHSHELDGQIALCQKAAGNLELTRFKRMSGPPERLPNTYFVREDGTLKKISA